MADSFRIVTLAMIALTLAGPAHAHRPWRADKGNTTGWQLMTPEERIEHQARIRDFDSYDECSAYQIEHHRQMATRAAERGLQLPPAPRDACARLRTPAQKP